MKGTEEKGCEMGQWDVWCGTGAGPGRGIFHLLSWWSVLSFHPAPVHVTTPGPQPPREGTSLQLLCSHCHFSLQQLSCYFSPAKSPPDSAPCQEEPAQLPTFYCFCFTAHGWADEIFSAHAPQTRGRRGQPGKSCLKAFQPCLPTLPCCRSGPCLPQLLCNTFAVIFPLNAPQGKKKQPRGG